MSDDECAKLCEVRTRAQKAIFWAFVVVSHQSNSQCMLLTQMNFESIFIYIFRIPLYSIVSGTDHASTAHNSFQTSQSHYISDELKLKCEELLQLFVGLTRAAHATSSLNVAADPNHTVDVHLGHIT